jgi:hypothetical protein
MDPHQLKIVVAGACILAKLLTGVALTRSGKPYGAGLLAIHKLISPAALALLYLAAQRVHAESGLDSTQIAVCVSAGVLFVASIATGGIVSVEKPMPAMVMALHRVLSFVTLIVTGAGGALLWG